jgi:3D (Asp-Asp-Asp) domain-containing protein
MNKSICLVVLIIAAFIPSAALSIDNTDSTCTDDWYVTGYFTPVESDYEGNTRTVMVEGKLRTFFASFLDEIRIEGWGKTMDGDYIWDHKGTYYSGPYAKDALDNKLEVGMVAADTTLIPFGTRISIPALNSSLGTNVFTVSDVGPAIIGKHIDVFTGEGPAAEAETLRITGNYTICLIQQISAIDAEIELEVDDIIKRAGSQFVVTAKVQNLQAQDTAGSITLVVGGFVTERKAVTLPSNGVEVVQFMWSSSDREPSIYTARAGGFGVSSNEVKMIQFDRLITGRASGSLVVGAQSVTDPETNEKLIVARSDRIAAILKTSDGDIRLSAPDGTLLIDDAAVERSSNVNDVVDVGGQKLVVRYIDLNDRLKFVTLKSANGEPLREGEWLVKIVDAFGHEANVEIRYYTSYVATYPSTDS